VIQADGKNAAYCLEQNPKMKKAVILKNLFVTLNCICLLVSASAVVVAQSPVKSIDQAGNVTYSDRPVAGAVSSEAVPVAPAPDPAEVKAARERLKKTGEMAEKARREREAREREEARRKAEAAKPEVVILREEGAGGYYPEYVNPPLLNPGPPHRPIGKPGLPAGGRPEHPAYRPPAARPPVSIQPMPR
jgi:hypothetical protein